MQFKLGNNFTYSRLKRHIRRFRRARLFNRLRRHLDGWRLLQRRLDARLLNVIDADMFGDSRRALAATFSRFERRLGAILKNTFFGRSCTSGNYDKILIGDSGNKISSNHLPSRYKFEPLSWMLKTDKESSFVGRCTININWSLTYADVKPMLRYTPTFCRIIWPPPARFLAIKILSLFT